MIRKSRKTTTLVTPLNVAAFGLLLAVASLVLYFAMPSEGFIPAVRYSMSGREFTWKGKQQDDVASCHAEAREQGRMIRSGYGTNILFEGCFIMSGNSVNTMIPGPL